MKLIAVPLGKIIVATTMIFLLGTQRKQGKPPSTKPHTVVTVTDEGVRCKRPDGQQEYVGWAELREVIVETKDKGPFVDDVFWILIGEHNSCVIPLGTVGEKELIERLQKLAGFDNKKGIEALGSTHNAKFILWKRENPTSSTQGH